MPIDPHAIFAQLTAKGATTPCNACGQTDFQVGEQSFLPNFDAGNVDLGRGISAFPVVCTNCGFIRLHAASTLEL